MSGGYHTDNTALTRSQLVEFVRSPEVYHGMFIAGTVPRKPPSKEMNIGTIAHAVLLERKPIDDLVIELPPDCFKSNGYENPKPSDEFRAANPGKFALKSDQIDNIHAICEAALKDERLSLCLKHAHACEQTIEATVHGRLCKCKPDVYGLTESAATVYDLKIGNVDQFRRNAKRLMYWLQDAHYSAVVSQHYERACRFKFCVVESKPPYRVRWYWYDEPSRETARDVHRKHIESLRECEASDAWKDDHDPVMVLEPWEVGGELLETWNG